MSGWHLAQINVARLLHPLDHPATSDFVAALEPINALADSSPGFVWRLQTGSGDATEIRVGSDDLLIVNMSVWESVEALRAFVYETGHADVMRRRREWFERPSTAIQALWWIPVGHLPTVAEGIERLEAIRKLGSTPTAFTFKDAQAPPAEAETTARGS